MNKFKSNVYHLHHSHITHKDKSRFDIFNKHKEYKKEDWLDHIRRHCDWGMPVTDNIDLTNYNLYENQSLFYVYKTTKIPKITLCIVNFRRYDILLKCLSNISSFRIAINVILWVNDSDSMTTDIREKVESIMSTFTNHEIIYSVDNKGTGYPRMMMLNKARHEYKTDYVMTTDDDIYFENVESLILGATILDQKEYNDYGSVGLWVDPLSWIVYIKDGKMIKENPKEGLFDVDCVGAASMTIRSSVIDKCNCDPVYKLGLVDWDFCMSIRNNDYKILFVCDPKYKPFNDTSENTPDYREHRGNKEVIQNSKKRFMEKWKITL